MVNLSNLRFDDRAPVYQQIAEYLKRQILLGTVQDGDPMPSRRELAAQTGINPNTAQKAYRLMTEEGYVVTDGNSGSFVRLTPALREQISEELTRGLWSSSSPRPRPTGSATKRSSPWSATFGATRTNENFFVP